MIQPEPGSTQERELLESGAIEVLGRMPWSSNATFLVKLEHDGVESLAVYKPRKGERPLWDFPRGTLCDREVAAHIVSEALGWGIVPLTILREGPAGAGMLQRFVDHDPEEHYFTLRENFLTRLHLLCFGKNFLRPPAFSAVQFEIGPMSVLTYPKERRRFHDHWRTFNHLQC